MSIRLLRHEESFEVRYSDGTPSKYFYFDDNAGRRAITGRVSSAEALQAAKAFARSKAGKSSAGTA